ncbi:MAE_28990/MAE_18760 family HEPN-like nuclease [Dolosigranulum pigrum]|nr:MAE_28990/MAE_18760 family HEPN-like nuclease [Dolosigranulum pigrum]
MLIDQRLLGNRNQIAHGKRLERLEGISNISDFLELHEAVYELIESFANNIKTAAQNEDYKSNKSGF